MKLKKLTIEQIPSYRDDGGKYECEISYESGKGTIELKLDTAVSNALLVCIGDVITQFANQAALEIKANLTSSILEAKNGTPAIEQEANAPQ